MDLLATRGGVLALRDDTQLRGKGPETLGRALLGIGLEP